MKFVPQPSPGLGEGVNRVAKGGMRSRVRRVALFSIKKPAHDKESQCARGGCPQD